MTGTPRFRNNFTPTRFFTPFTRVKETKIQTHVEKGKDRVAGVGADSVPFVVTGSIGVPGIPWGWGPQPVKPSETVSVPGTEGGPRGPVETAKTKRIYASTTTGDLGLAFRNMRVRFRCQTLEKGVRNTCGKKILVFPFEQPGHTPRSRLYPPLAL